MSAVVPWIICRYSIKGRSGHDIERENADGIGGEEVI